MQSRLQKSASTADACLITDDGAMMMPQGSNDLAAQPAPQALLSDVLDSACVLIVDDEPVNVTLLDAVLRSVGVPDVHGVTDPRQAVRRCQEVAADVVLLDLHMPKHDGFAVLAELKANLPEDAFVPVLVLTADSTTATRDRALHAGATDFLTKPFDRLEVILRVRNLLQTRALYLDVQARNAELAAELEQRKAAEHEREQRHRARLARIDDILDRRAYTMVFQPITDLETGVVVGVEALARFGAEPRRPPNVWFDEAASVGRQLELEVGTATAALAQLDRLPDEAFLTLNVSPATAISQQFADVLDGIPPSRVVLELTEHTRVDDYALLLAGLSDLREQGFRIAVDDAGAGYAGLRHVLQLSPDMLKLDIDLIRFIDRDPAKRALSSALVTFARETGATVVAEGIETSEELDVLAALGIRWGQGFHLARPGPLPLERTSIRRYSDCS